jgi:hypothetical protein
VALFLAPRGQDLAGLKCPTRPDKARHDVTGVVMFSENLFHLGLDSTTKQKPLFSQEGNGFFFV